MTVTKFITADRTPKIIVSTSGMATGGRVVHHLKKYIIDKNNTVIFAGFQAGGTRGGDLVNGADKIKISEVRPLPEKSYEDRQLPHILTLVSRSAVCPDRSRVHRRYDRFKVSITRAELPLKRLQITR